jgi:hypothetical protein
LKPENPAISLVTTIFSSHAWLKMNGVVYSQVTMIQVPNTNSTMRVSTYMCKMGLGDAKV